MPARRKVSQLKRMAALVAALVTLVLLGCGGSDGDGDRPKREPGPRDEGVVVWAVGDGADGSERAKALARRIARDDPDRFLYLGDVYDRGTADEFEHNYEPVYGELAEVTAPTPGNHDWPSRAEGYDPYWREKTGRDQPPWYGFELGGWEIFSVNSQAPHGRRSPQLRWLRAAVRGGGDCRLVFSHRPRWSAGPHGDQDDMAPVWNAIRGRARIFLAGHEHNSQRFPPFQGTAQFVAGAGGYKPYPLPEDPRLAFGRTGVDNALRLELEPGRARFAFVTASGERLDSGELTCRRAP